MRPALIGIILVILFLVFIRLEVLDFTYLGADQVRDAKPVWLVPLVVSSSTFFGVFARAVLEVIFMRGGPKTYAGVLSEAIKPNRFLAALIIAPIVVAFFYKTIRSTDEIGFMIAVSVQNGFFWKTIVRMR